MERRLILILALCRAIPCQGYYSQSKPYVPPREKVTKLHFFFHDTISGKNPTAILVARPNFAAVFKNTPIPFGSVFATDDPITLGPNLTSGVIGNAQGIWASTGQDVLTLVVYWDVGFTQGKFNGSSITMFSRNPIAQMEREVAVVGGRGKFRMAKGFAQLKTYFADFTTGDAIVECNVTVIYHRV
ncbi:Dirigent protein 4 [Hibiscus syriacus]|uniref:Dirigent protein n=1 Tax=Hibiscus syriacus TaxID=106335 RepID=A0A6A3A4Z7_HIBSY|nr:dirigent protein 4-like [Hibiscus syriacus]KAE8698717.1 Dirigent protein 4 [Hibiscus syriacus]